MSSVRFVLPKLKLEELIRTPGGLPVAEALARAHANLATLKPASHAELLVLLEHAEAVFRQPETPGDDVLAELYAIAVRGIGAGAVCGAPEVDGALGSLCDLIDHLQSSHRLDRDALGVHLRAWRLLMDPEMATPGATVILDGLRKISGRFATPAA